MVAGRLNYCNAVLYGSSSMNIDKLQRVQVVSKTHRRDHITPVLADLHWLPVHYRIEYKIALLTYKAVTIQQPQYLSELIRLYETPKQLRPRGANILQYSPAVLNFSRSAFCHASPTIWNNLPVTVISDITVSTDTFKSRLKTALYSRCLLYTSPSPRD